MIVWVSTILMFGRILSFRLSSARCREDSEGCSGSCAEKQRHREPCGWRGSYVTSHLGSPDPPYDPRSTKTYIQLGLTSTTHTSPPPPVHIVGPFTGGTIIAEPIDFPDCPLSPSFHAQGGCPKDTSIRLFGKASNKANVDLPPSPPPLCWSLGHRSMCMYETMSLGQEGEK